jgi:hypothetical protein
VTPAVAAGLATQHPADRIRAKVEVLDWLIAKKDKQVAKNPAGYLVASIRDDYSPPKGFEPAADRARRLEAEARQEQARRRARAEQRGPRDEGERSSAAWRTAWDALPASEREEIRRAVVAGKPYLERAPRLVEGLCLEELARRRGATFGPGTGSVLGPEALAT